MTTRSAVSLFTGGSPGAIERLSGLLVDHGLPAPQPVADAEELKAIDGEFRLN